MKAFGTEILLIPRESIHTRTNHYHPQVSQRFPLRVVSFGLAVEIDHYPWLRNHVFGKSETRGTMAQEVHILLSIRGSIHRDYQSLLSFQIRIIQQLSDYCLSIGTIPEIRPTGLRLIQIVPMGFSRESRLSSICMGKELPQNHVRVRRVQNSEANADYPCWHERSRGFLPIRRTQ